MKMKDYNKMKKAIIYASKQQINEKELDLMLDTFARAIITTTIQYQLDRLETISKQQTKQNLNQILIKDKNFFYLNSLLPYDNEIE